MRPKRLGRMASVAVLLGTGLLRMAVAQTDPGGHLGHHPGQAPPEVGAPRPAAPTTGTRSPTPPLQAGAGCGGMMGCMGGGPRPFYATLLEMPELTPEARQFIQIEAERRIGWGSEAIAAGQARLQRAFSANDPASAGQATATIRDGLLRLESGTAALRAIDAGTSPRQFALTWFRDQLAVPTAEAATVTDDGPWGLSWYHVITMAFLIVFLAGALMIQFARSRRIGGLVARLTPAKPAPATDAAAPGPSAPAVPAPPVKPGSLDAAAAGSGKPASAPVKRPWSGALRVVAIFQETLDVKTFRLANPAGGDIPFAFLPGQFLTFSAEINGGTVRRSYTIASSPAQRGYVEITVKREELGAESRYLHDQVTMGDPLQISGPSGVFTFTGDEAASIVLIGGGVGITPMMCVIRYLTDRAFAGEIFFLYGARSPADFIFREELDYLQKRHANLHVAATMAHAEGAAWTGAVGNITKEFIARAVPDIARRRVHVCGPPPMMYAVKAELLELGVARDKIKTEAFGPAQGAAPVPLAAPDVRPAQPVQDSATAASDVTPPKPAAGVPLAAAQVEFSSSGKTGPLAPDQTVLEAAEAIGVAIDFSCRVGTCGTCVVPLKAGKVTMEVEDGLPPGDKARGIILACQAKSVGDLVVEA